VPVPKPTAAAGFLVVTRDDVDPRRLPWHPDSQIEHSTHKAIILTASIGSPLQLAELTTETSNARTAVREQHLDLFAPWPVLTARYRSGPPRLAAGNGIFVVGDRRPKTCLRDETYEQRRKSRPHDREKPAENRLFRRQVFHGEFRWTAWWAQQGSNLGTAD
jgi:hypothetical protein